MSKKGFTLIELLVVIAIIALLLAILMPALRKVKEQASAIPCLANQRTLALAFHMYQEENNGWLVTSHAWFTPTDKGDPPKYSFARSWVCRPLDDNGNAGEPKPEYEKNGIRAGKLWPYIEDVKSYHCPADQRAGRYNVGWRSYSMAAGIGGSYDSYVTEKQEIHRMQELKRPSHYYITIEEIEKLPNGQDWWNMGSWVIDLSTSYWYDAVASWHSWGCNFAFADGHAERIKWKDDWTKEWLGGDADKQALSMESDPGRREASENPDLEYMLDHFPYKK